MLLTLSGIAMLDNDEHLSKAPSPMLVTLSGMPMLVNDSHPEKAQQRMSFVPGFIV